MASSYTTNLKIQQIANGEQSGIWGSSTDTNWTLIEQAVAGVQTITMANANYTLTNLNGILDEARNMVLQIQGTNNSVYQIIIPSNQTKFYVVSNNTTGGYAITIGTSGGSLISIPNGTTAQVYTDGTNTYSAQTGSSGNFTVNGNLIVTGNETEVGTLTASTLSVTNNTSFAVSPTAPTPTAGDSSTKVATTAFVQTATGTLGTMATQNANAVAITGGTINGVTGTNSGFTAGNVSGTVAVANGGTGVTTSTGSGANVLNTSPAITTPSIDTIKSTSTTSPTVFQNSAGTEIGQLIKAWVVFDGTTSPPTIRSSFNVSSVTKYSTGQYLVTMTNAMVDKNYVVLGSVINGTTPAVNGASFVGGNDQSGSTPGSQTTTQFNIGTFQNGTSFQDFQYTNIMVIR